jgi:hypothetical protein
MRRISICLILLSLTGTLSPYKAHAQQPTIHLTPASGTINSQITVDGENFTAGQKVMIFIGLPDTAYANTPYSAALVEKNGTFTTSFVMPGTWANGDPIVESKLVIVAVDAAGDTASASFDYTPAPLETLGWTRYGNRKFAFSLMVPPGWVVHDFDDTIDIEIEDNPQAGSIKILLTPVSFIEGGNIGGKEVGKLPLKDYAAIALQYELGGAGTFTLQQTYPVTTQMGHDGYAASWEFDFVPLGTVESAGTESAIGTPSIPELYTAVYFDLNVVRGGNFYRAIEIGTAAGQVPSSSLFKTILHSLSVSRPVSETDYAALMFAVATYLQQSGLTADNLYLEVQAIDGDYIRFVTPPTGVFTVETATGYARKLSTTWTIFGIGTAFDTAFYEQHDIPTALRR